MTRPIEAVTFNGLFLLKFTADGHAYYQLANRIGAIKGGHVAIPSPRSQ